MEKQKLTKKQKHKVNKEVKRILMKLARDDKLLTEMSWATKGFMKLNVKEQRAMMKHIKRTDDNSRWLAFQEVFGELYPLLEEKAKKNLIWMKVWGFKEFNKGYQKAILETKLDIRELEKKIRKKYHYWKVKKKKQLGDK